MAKAGDQYSVRTGNIWNFCQRDDVKTVNHLVDDDGIDLALRNKVGWTPLHAAASGGAERVIALLIRRRAEVDARCRAGRTPLAEAARNGHLSAVKALVKAGAQLFVEDGEGNSVTDVAKGAACRSWLAGRCACSNAQAADEQAVATPRAASGRHEKRAEHQKIGAGGKAKAKQLKQQRAKARAQAAAAADEDDGDAIVDTADGDADYALVIARQPLLPPSARTDAICLYATTPASVCEEALRAAITLPADLQEAEASRHILCVLLDARHPLLFLPPALYAALVDTGMRFILCLTKSEMLTHDQRQAWLSYLKAAFPRAAAVIAISAIGRCRDDENSATSSLVGGGAASRRRWLSSHITSAERANARRDGEALAAACGVQLPAQRMHLVRGVWRAIDPADAPLPAVDTVRPMHDAMGADDDGSEEEESDAESVEQCSFEDEPAGEADDATEQPPLGGDGESSSRTIITLLGRCNAGKSSVLNLLAGGRRVASVSRQPGHTRKVQSARLSSTLLVRDTPALDLSESQAWAAHDQDGRPMAGVAELCGLSPSGAIRSPYAAVRAIAETTHIERIYGMQPNELKLAEDVEDTVVGGLSAYGFCYSLAAKKGFLQSRNGTPDPHRAGLLIIRDAAQGALPWASQPPVALSEVN